MVKRRRDHDGVFALRLVALPRDCRNTEGLCLELGALLLLAFRFKCDGISSRLTVTAWAEVGFGDTVRLPFAADPRRVKSETAEGLNNLDFQLVLIVPRVAKSHWRR